MTKKSFASFLALHDRERKAVFEKTGKRLGIPSYYVEKDFWICFVLDILYNRLPEGHPKLLFKGGTALSKAFELVRRFSEDVDLAVDREGLGFGPDRDPTSAEGLSRKKRKALFNELKEACSTYMLNDLSPALASLLSEWCEISLDDRDNDRQTLLVKYHSLYSGASSDYVLPEVKIEGGARSVFDPNTTTGAAPYICEELADGWSFKVGNLHVIEPSRTYLEKFLILHGIYCGYRDHRRLPKDGSRISRHYYDVAMLTKTEICKAALSDKNLLTDVREHNLIAFPSEWRKYEEAVPGSLHLVPQDGSLRAVIEKDFKAMQSMLFGEIPSFEWVLDQIHFAENAVNQA